jgi:hypothetical protein
MKQHTTWFAGMAVQQTKLRLCVLFATHLQFQPTNNAGQQKKQ